MNVRPEGFDLRLVPAACTAWVAAWWAVAAQPVTAAVAAAGCLAGCLMLWVRTRRRRSVRSAAAALAIAGAAAVLAAAAAAGAARQAGPLPGWAAGRITVQIEGRVSGDPRRLTAGRFGQSERYLVRLSADRGVTPGQRYRLASTVTVLGGAGWAAPSAGQRVSARGRLQPADGGRDATAVLIARGPPRLLDAGPWPWRVAQRLRVGLRDACRGLPPDVAGLLPALVVGDTSRLPDDLRDDMRTAGLTHLTAVSGANVAIVCGAALGAAALLGARRRTRLVLAALALAGFVVLARPEPSVLRAGVMGAVGLAGLAAARTPGGVPALAGCVLVLLAVDPWLARSYGFALSVLATAGLMLLAPVWVHRLERRMPRPLALLLAAPAAALALTAPVTVLLQPSVSLAAVPANLVAAPAVAPATVLGVLAALASVPAPAAAAVLAWLGGLGTAWISLVAHRAAALPGAAVPWPPGLLGAVLLAVVVLALVVLSVVRGPPGRGRAVLVPGTVLAAAAAGWVLAPRLPLPGGPGDWPARDWQLVMCEVGQGDALVLRSGPRSAIMIDTGPDPGPVDGCLRRLDVARLDLVVLTHAHADHVDGLAGALRGRGRPPVLVGPLARPAAGAAAVRRDVAAAGSRQVVAADGLAGTAGAGSWRVQWQVLWPRLGLPDTTDDDAINDASLVMVLRSARLSLVALGDVEVGAQRLLAPRLAGLGPVDVVKVAHHGSASQFPPLYGGLSARVALIGVGADNDYGHPAAPTLAMLRGSGAVVLRTDTDGDLAVLGSGRRLAVRVGHRARLAAPRAAAAG